MNGTTKPTGFAPILAFELTGQVRIHRRTQVTTSREGCWFVAKDKHANVYTLVYFPQGSEPEKEIRIRIDAVPHSSQMIAVEKNGLQYFFPLSGPDLEPHWERLHPLLNARESELEYKILEDADLEPTWRLLEAVRRRMYVVHSTALAIQAPLLQIKAGAEGVLRDEIDFQVMTDAMEAIEIPGFARNTLRRTRPRASQTDLALEAAFQRVLVFETLRMEYAAAQGPAQRSLREQMAMVAVQKDCQTNGWTTTDVSLDHEGYDLRVQHPSHGARHIEIKGTSLQSGQITLTVNEMREAKADPQGWVLAVGQIAENGDVFLRYYHDLDFANLDLNAVRSITFDIAGLNSRARTVSGTLH